jgi:hypothetical protein
MTFIIRHDGEDHVIEPQDDKFIVFRRKEFEEFESYYDRSPIDMGFHPVEDATVIRCRDIFAGPVLHTYANIVAMMAGFTENGPLMAVADYFAGRAELADQINAAGEARVPD